MKYSAKTATNKNGSESEWSYLGSEEWTSFTEAKAFFEQAVKDLPRDYETECASNSSPRATMANTVFEVMFESLDEEGNYNVIEFVTYSFQDRQDANTYGIYETTDGISVIARDYAMSDNYRDSVYFFAPATDLFGNRYTIKWEVADPKAEYPENACDWDNPEGIYLETE